LGELQRFRAIPGVDDVMAPHLQQPEQTVARILMVLDQEDAQRVGQRFPLRKRNRSFHAGAAKSEREAGAKIQAGALDGNRSPVGLHELLANR
jgi:hypothetical protein